MHQTITQTLLLRASGLEVMTPECDCHLAQFGLSLAFFHQLSRANSILGKHVSIGTIRPGGTEQITTKRCNYDSLLLTDDQVTRICYKYSMYECSLEIFSRAVSRIGSSLARPPIIPAHHASHAMMR